MRFGRDVKFLGSGRPQPCLLYSSSRKTCIRRQSWNRTNRLGDRLSHLKSRLPSPIWDSLDRGLHSPSSRESLSRHGTLEAGRLPGNAVCPAIAFNVVALLMTLGRMNTPRPSSETPSDQPRAAPPAVGIDSLAAVRAWRIRLRRLKPSSRRNPRNPIAAGICRRSGWPSVRFRFAVGRDRNPGLPSRVPLLRSSAPAAARKAAPSVPSGH